MNGPSRMLRRTVQRVKPQRLAPGCVDHIVFHAGEYVLRRMKGTAMGNLNSTVIIVLPAPLKGAAARAAETCRLRDRGVDASQIFDLADRQGTIRARPGVQCDRFGIATGK